MASVRKVPRVRSSVNVAPRSPICSAFGCWEPVELNRATQLRKGFAKLRGRATYDSLKLAIEVRHGLKAACEGSFANSRVGIEQKRLRFLHSNSR